MASISTVGNAPKVMRAVTWLGGPYDGSRTLVEPDAVEYAVAYNKLGERIVGPKVQLYVSDPGYWLKERDRRVTVVHVFPVIYSPDASTPVICWHSKNFRVIEVGAER
jgi:hypothetical protein